MRPKPSLLLSQLHLPSQMAQPKDGSEDWQAADQEDDDEEEEWEEA